MTRSSCVSLTLCTIAVLGCLDNGPTPVLSAVQPGSAYSGTDLRLLLFGTDFIPSFQMDPVSGWRLASSAGFSGRMGKGEVWRPLTDFGWLAPDRLSAGLNAGDLAALPVGACDIEIDDPRGARAVLTDAFYALGPDLSPPIIQIESPEPDAKLAAGSTLLVVVTASDQAPGKLASLTWRYRDLHGEKEAGTCSRGQDPASMRCAFQIAIATGLPAESVVQVELTAFDSSANVTVQSITIPLIAAPTIESITPSMGGEAGGTDVLIKGSGFQPDAKAYFDGLPLLPNGGIVLDTATISGHVPPHEPGAVDVVVRSKLTDALRSGGFNYGPAPKITSITPEVGNMNQPTPVRIAGEGFTKKTQFRFGPTLESATLALLYPQFEDETLFTGEVPPAWGSTTVWAYDPDMGWSCRLYGFSWGEQ